MMKFITVQVAARTIMVILSATIVFHLLVLTEVVPYQVAWGGRLKSYEEMVVFELVSIVISLLMILLAYLKLRFFTRGEKHTVTNAMLWIMAILFSLNTVGNLFAVSLWEKVTATPITLVLALLCFRLATAKPNSTVGNPV